MVRIITIQSFVVDQIIILFIDYIVITHHPQSDITLAKGNMLLLSVTANGPGRNNFKYQWKKRDSNLPNRVKVKDTSNITISSVTPSDSGSYYCVVTNQWGNMTESNDASVNVLRKSHVLFTLY